MSHDLRAPLRAIDGYAHILVEDHADALNDESRRVLDVIRTNARQMGRLIDDLLTFSRLGRDRARLRHDRSRGLVGLRRRRAPAPRPRPRTVDVVDRRRSPPPSSTAAMMRQAFANLIGNAWKFTREPRRRHDRDRLHARTGRETVYFVRDNGAGFDMRYASKLFRVFERLHRADEFDGTGVGLAIVQRVVQRHGGRVWADAAVGARRDLLRRPATRERSSTMERAQRGDSVGGGQPGGRRAGGASAQEA